MPACAGKDPQLFEFDMFYSEAVAICSSCPVRAWCLREVDPIRYKEFEGVAGGHAWKNGYALPQHSNALNDTVLHMYIDTRARRQVGRPAND